MVIINTNNHAFRDSTSLIYSVMHISLDLPFYAS